MPIRYRIDHAQQLVVVVIRGILSDEEIFGYQREVWSRPDVQGYDELADMREVERIAVASPERVRDLAQLSAEMDRGAASKFAIVAPQEVAFGLARMYEALRKMNPKSKKQVEAFRTLPEALAWLGISELPPEEADEPSETA
jgi:hypothetical protein